MNMPNRFREVSVLCGQHPEAFPQGAENDPARLKFLSTIVIPSLNTVDGGKWGLCTKTDQGGKVPVDVLMWKDTREIVDCLTGTGACWITFPSLPPQAWVWTPVGNVPPPVGTVGYDEGQVAAFIQDDRNAYDEAHHAIDAGFAIWVARMTWDAPTLGWTASRAKHLAELRAALGLV